jgi:hypothetical protein
MNATLTVHSSLLDEAAKVKPKIATAYGWIMRRIPCPEKEMPSSE